MTTIPNLRRNDEIMKLIVGLGNPGAKYRMNRHNVGYMVLAELAEKYGNIIGGNRPQSKFHGDLLDIREPGGESILLLAPTTYMNRSGLSVGEAVNFYKIPLSDVLVVCDDLNLPFCKLRFRSEGSSGGQKGLGDTLKVLGTDKVSRLRIGIGSPPGQMDAADYVLMNFTEKEQTDLKITVKQAADAVVFWTNKGIGETMNRYNSTQ
ncbi:MAG: aminoacyl-tRNA hydrolase [Planctomycetaceae bacterium]|jgi:PTH1 family peptidyl-tRNA hydrolase|nr:aminoacyl-tRNA hydrolase [Planctomycetaceae bacterium]